MRLAIGDFAPDLDPVISGIARDNIPPRAMAILVDSQWVYSTRGGIRNMPGPTPYASPLSSTALGAFVAQIGGQSVLVLATANQLYLVPGGALVNQGLTLKNISNPWSFAAYGADLLATDGVDPVQVSTNGGPFMALPGNPPIFAILSSNPFSLFGIPPNSQDYWFTFNDTLWTPNIATLTGTGTLSSTPGFITAAKSLRAGEALFKAQSLFYGSFIGTGDIWDFNPVDDTIGTPGPNSAVEVVGPTIFGGGPVLIFVGPSDFYVFDGFSLNEIPNNLSRWFFGSNSLNGDLDSAYAPNIFAQWDQPRTQIIFWYPSVRANPRGTLDSYISLSLVTGKWMRGSRTIDTPLQGILPASTGWTYARFQNTYGSYAPLPPYPPVPTPSPGVPHLTYGSSMFVGSTVLLTGYVDSNHALQVLNGPYLAVRGASVTLAGIGDKVNVYQISRALPGFNQYPQGQPMASPAKLRIFGTYVAGQQPIQKGKDVPISDTGFFDFVSTDKIQRPQVEWYSDAELADLEVEVDYAGEN